MLQNTVQEHWNDHALCNYKGETFTFAVDITGTGWVDQIQAGGPQGSTRCMAANIWTNYGPKKDATNRLKHIQGNIYGATYNFQQMLEE